MESTDNQIASRIVDHFGGRSRAAKHLGRSVETIRLWLEKGIPLSQAIDVEQKTDGVVTAEEILQNAKKVRAEEERKLAA